MSWITTRESLEKRRARELVEERKKRKIEFERTYARRIFAGDLSRVITQKEEFDSELDKYIMHQRRIEEIKERVKKLGNGLYLDWMLNRSSK